MSIRSSRMVAAVLAAGAIVAIPGVASAETSAASASASAVGSGWSWDSGRSGNDRQDAVGLTDGGKALVKFDTDRPERADKIGPVSGLAGDTFLVGIDYRVQDGKLYGVGNAGGIYTISDRDAKASKVGQLSVALSGTKFGVDFNPAANALRVISDTGQNLRQSFAATPLAPTAVDGTLTYPASPTAPAATGTGITGAAYTNNDVNPDTGTTLFDLDTVLDQIVIQAPANAGSLSATGKLGVNADLDAGFDIYASLRKGKAVENSGFATIGVGGKYSLYSINLLTGQADAEGSFKSAVTDIAIQLD